jgi:hypothetical protein
MRKESSGAWAFGSPGVHGAESGGCGYCIGIVLVRTGMTLRSTLWTVPEGPLGSRYLETVSVFRWFMLW